MALQLTTMPLRFMGEGVTIYIYIYSVAYGTILDKNTLHPIGILPDKNTDYTSGDPRIFSQLHPPLLINEHKHPFGTTNPKFQCFF